MEEKTIIYEVSKEYKRTETDKERLIFNRDKDGNWLYHAPNAQDHNEEQVKEILKILEKLKEEMY